jgi:pimeloyl-ACP methyl ester carboxylesterase
MATYCLIHGNWHDGSCWDRLTPLLEERNHVAIAPDLPIDDPGTTWEERVRPVLLAIEDAGESVVVVGHSAASGYAAIVASRAQTRLLVHLCPRFEQFQPAAGTPRVFRDTLEFPQRRPDGAIAWEPELARRAMYPRLDPGVADELARTLRPSAPPAGEFPLARHPDVPTALVYATDDEFFEPDWERFIARELLGVKPIEIPGGHFPMAEDPEGLARVLDRLAGPSGG